MNTNDVDRLLWEAGEVRPWRITQALDLHSLEGPEVDTACGATEPEVDWWEAGILYPTWEQLQALADLTDMPVAFFLNDSARPPAGPAFVCTGSGRGKGCTVVEPEPAVERFSYDVVRATVGAA